MRKIYEAVYRVEDSSTLHTDRYGAESLSHAIVGFVRNRAPSGLVTSSLRVSEVTPGRVAVQPLPGLHDGLDASIRRGFDWSAHRFTPERLGPFHSLHGPGSRAIGLDRNTHYTRTHRGSYTSSRSGGITYDTVLQTVRKRHRIHVPNPAFIGGPVSSKRRITVVMPLPFDSSKWLRGLDADRRAETSSKGKRKGKGKGRPALTPQEEYLRAVRRGNLSAAAGWARLMG